MNALTGIREVDFMIEAGSDATIIEEVYAREILDSRGNPTIEVRALA